MTTQSWSTVIDHTDDAGFRAWGAELNAKLAAAGLVQTADTGQIDWSTVNRAGTNSNAGYEMWRMDDTQQATAPIFFRIDYGTGAAANFPRLKLTLGTGSDGAGAITGTATTGTIDACPDTGSALGGIARNSYLCVTEGFCGLVWKLGAANTGLARGGFIIDRSRDADGVPTADGAVVLTQNGTTNGAFARVQSLRFASPATVFTAVTTLGQIFVPGGETTSAVDADYQAYLGCMLTPRVLPVLGWCGATLADAPKENTFSATLIGSTPHTYLQLDHEMGENISAVTPTLHGLCMLFE